VVAPLSFVARLYKYTVMSFRCRLCGSDVFEQVSVRRPDGSLYRSALLACGGCSAVFTDPERFAARILARPAIVPNGKGAGRGGRNETGG